MEKRIQQLIPDVQEQLTRKGWMSAETADQFGQAVSSRLLAKYGEQEKSPTLRLSQMGPRCPRALWYSIHHPELAEPLPPGAEFKYDFGHVIEALAISHAKAAGHLVQGEQDELVVDGVRGHRDCVVDGCILDVKSSSTRGMAKFYGSIEQDDPFGYLDQLDGYLCGSLDDPLVKVKDRAYILAIDKQLGTMVLYEHKFREAHIRARIAEYKSIVAQSTPPHCRCQTITEDNGNTRLDLRASYSPQKFCCFPNLRTCLYSGGKPVFFTNVVKWPRNSNGPLPEIDKFGQLIHPRL